MRILLRKISLYLLILIILNFFTLSFANGYMFSFFLEAFGKREIYLECMSSGGGYKDVIEIVSNGIDDRNEEWRLARIDANNQFLFSKALRDLGIKDVNGFEAMHTSAAGDIYLSVINYNETNTLYVIKNGREEAKRIFSTSANSGEKIVSIAEKNQECSFLVKSKEKVKAFKINLEERNAIHIADFDRTTFAPGDDIFFVLPDGSAMRRVGKELYYSDKLFVKTGENSNVTNVWEADRGALYLDVSDGSIWAKFLGNPNPLKYESVMTGAPGITHIEVDLKGDIWVIDDNEELLHYYGNTFERLTDKVVRPKHISIIISVAFELLLMLITLLIWYTIAETLKMHYSLVIRWGVFMVVASTIIYKVTCYQLYYVTETSFAEAVFEYLNLTNYANPTTKELRKIRTDFNRIEFERDENNSICYEDDGGKQLIETLGYGSVYVKSVKEAFEHDGVYNSYYFRNGKHYYISALKTSNNKVRIISVREYIDSSDAMAIYRHFTRIFLTLMILLWIASVVVLSRIAMRTINISRRTRGLMYETEPINDNEGDEISSIHDALNSVGVEIREAMHELDEHRKCYEKFMPKNVVELLGVKEAFEINRKSCSKHRLIMMTVSFKLDDALYTSEVQEIYAKLNNVVERASRILDEHEGTVLDFRYDGFVALFRESNSRAVVAAIKIAQEFQKDEDVVVHIVLDSDMVCSGIIGNDTKMQALAISNSYKIGAKLLSFLDRAEAGIVCTEVIHTLTNEYENRYIGKVKTADSETRVYEIISADLPEIKSKKLLTEKIFMDAVYSFYSGDYKSAKGEFLQVVRENAHDGIAKYYLYLADEYEDDGKKRVSYIE